MSIDMIARGKRKTSLQSTINQSNTQFAGSQTCRFVLGYRPPSLLSSFLPHGHELKIETPFPHLELEDMPMSKADKKDDSVVGAEQRRGEEESRKVRDHTE